jgi:hypothetical protein
MTAARLDASSAPRLAGMKADAKLATRERVSMASARFGVIGAPAGRRITQPSTTINRYDTAVALMSTIRRLGLPRTRSSICRSTAAVKRATLLSPSDVPSAWSIRRRSDWKYVPRPSTTAIVNTVRVAEPIANARKTPNHSGVSGRPISAHAAPAPTMIVVPSRYASRSSATAAVACRASTDPDRSRTLSGSPTIAPNVR